MGSQRRDHLPKEDPNYSTKQESDCLRDRVYGVQAKLLPHNLPCVTHDNVIGDARLLEDLVLANHILHHNHVVDAHAFGHVSIRHPTDPSRFIMSANMARALVRSAADLAEYNVGDAPNLPIVTGPKGASWNGWGPLSPAISRGAGHHADLPEQAVVLMRRHGFTTWGTSLKGAIYRAVYATKNAKLQTAATLLRGAFDADPKNARGDLKDGGPTGPIHASEPLTQDQARDANIMNSRAGERVWVVWVQEVKCQALYTSSVYQG
ncbi:hypothetical protein G647_08703 [Cladophialophora carrionii CBS 160.54]|uniref:Class II aldolase/adducin N-terminal domain-containing protein n=1 Tax=Cladophialophora carrionii CBS 160.54 TaxID=1279043 RepID=V9CYG3_9EURO|nr:uncharacterized protein G647_08703 [Cladophialophora carrionii CBS 160.54]ETI19690.1 hypothetical protein G647_08703 [Cladophialophora carrionii CBS 160.54]